MIFLGIIYFGLFSQIKSIYQPWTQWYVVYQESSYPDPIDLKIGFRYINTNVTAGHTIEPKINLGESMLA